MFYTLKSYLNRLFLGLIALGLITSGVAAGSLIHLKAELNITVQGSDEAQKEKALSVALPMAQLTAIPVPSRKPKH